MRNLLLLHLIVLIFGFTGILGKLISIPSEALVWYRMFFASISIGLFLILKKKTLQISKNGITKTILTGFIIAIHWILFFEAIKRSNVSITLSALATASLFTAILEPLFFNRKFYFYELFLGVLVLLGLYSIFRFETENSIGVWLGVLSAFFASLFTVINGRLIKQYESTTISLFELSGGVIAISAYFFIFKAEQFPNFQIAESDWYYLVILAVICTAFAFVVSVDVMKELPPFTVSLSINLEPVYGIILAFLFFGEEEKMSFGFYIGTLLILSSLFLNAWFKRRIKKKGYIFLS